MHTIIIVAEGVGRDKATAPGGRMVDYTFVNEAGEEVVTKISLRFAVRLLRLRGGSIR